MERLHDVYKNTLSTYHFDPTHFVLATDLYHFETHLQVRYTHVMHYLLTPNFGHIYEERKENRHTLVYVYMVRLTTDWI